MDPSDQVTAVVFEILEASRRRRRQWREEATRRGLTLEQLQARRIADALSGVSAPRNRARYVLTDASGQHYWNGHEFAPMGAADHAIPDHHCFCSNAEALAVAALLREAVNLHLLVLQLGS